MDRLSERDQIVAYAQHLRETLEQVRTARQHEKVELLMRLIFGMENTRTLGRSDGLQRAIDASEEFLGSVAGERAGNGDVQAV